MATTISYYRDRCTPPLTQKELALALHRHHNTVQNWERSGVPHADDLLKLVSFFVEQGAIRDLQTATQFWESSRRGAVPIPPELAEMFATMPPPTQLLPDDLPMHAPLPRQSQMPLQRNRLFTGRNAALRELAAALNTLDASVVVAGMGGIGKTQLVCEFVHRYGQFFPGGVFWISFADARAIPAHVAACGGEGHLALHPHFEMLPLERQVRLVKAAWREPIPRLLIFDNCEDEDLLAEWRPTSGGCRVVITSRRQRWSAALISHLLRMPLFERLESVTLLRQHARNLPSTFAPLNDHSEQQALDDIAAMLGDLPLAIHLAGAHLAYHYQELRPTQYLAQLHAATLQADQLVALLKHPSLEGGVFSPTSHEQHLARAFVVSYERLQPHNPIDAMALALLARAAHLAPGEPIPRRLLLATLPSINKSTLVLAEEALRRLVSDLGLLEVNSVGTVRMHRLVASFVRAIHQGAQAQHDVEEMLLAEAKQITLNRKQAELLAIQPHMRYVTDAAFEREDLLAARLCAAFGEQLQPFRAMDEALRYFHRSLAIREALLKPDDPEIAACLDGLGVTYQMNSDFRTARPYFERALAIWQMRGIEDTLELGQLYVNLGDLLRVQSELEEAQAFLEDGIALIERHLGADHLQVAFSLNHLGYLLYMREQYDAAEQAFRRALAIHERARTGDTRDLAQSLNNLGDLLCHMGRYDEAWECHERSLAIREAIFGPQHNDVAESLKNMGIICYRRGQYDKAQSYLERSLAICIAVLGADNIEVAWSHEWLGDIFDALNQPQMAQMHYQRAIAIYVLRFGEQHPTTVQARERLESCMAAQGLMSRYLEFG